MNIMNKHLTSEEAKELKWAVEEIQGMAREWETIFQKANELFDEPRKRTKARVEFLRANHKAEGIAFFIRNQSALNLVSKLAP